MEKFPDGASNFEIKKYVIEVVKGLFRRDLKEKITYGYPIVFFGGDICAPFALATMFYQITKLATMTHLHLSSRVTFSAALKKKEKKHSFSICSNLRLIRK